MCVQGSISSGPMAIWSNIFRFAQYYGKDFWWTSFRNTLLFNLITPHSGALDSTRGFLHAIFVGIKFIFLHPFCFLHALLRPLLYRMCVIAFMRVVNESYQFELKAVRVNQKLHPLALCRVVVCTLKKRVLFKLYVCHIVHESS